MAPTMTAPAASGPAGPDRGGGSRLGAVVVGTGFGCYSHVRALRHAGFDVHAVVGRDPSKTAERARLFEVPRACTSLSEALDGDRIEAVTTTHGERTADEYVICGGSWTSEIARQLKLDLPMQAGKGYSLTIANPRRRCSARPSASNS